jgi:phosphomannomutase
MKKFIFDVDGTLTPSRQQITPEFNTFFISFCFDKNVYLVSGSDYKKTYEQLGETICYLAKRIYNCSGSYVTEKGEVIYQREWLLPKDAKNFLTDKLNESRFPARYGLHFEDRPGMCNFSVVGRHADSIGRKKYVDWNKENKQDERISIAKEFNYLFPGITAKVGGDTGIDIFPTGNDKSQIVRDFDKEDIIYFFGDKMNDEGNDFPLKQRLMNDNYNASFHSVTCWQDTYNILKNEL